MRVGRKKGEEEKKRRWIYTWNVVSSVGGACQSSDALNDPIRVS